MIVGASKVARDITEQKMARQQLSQMMEEMQRNDRMKVEFVATLSHELRTPLNAIIGWIEILKGDDVKRAEFSEGLAAIERNARSQVQMIEDLLDMSRIEFAHGDPENIAKAPCRGACGFVRGRGAGRSGDF